jgi:hypothetical protein
VKTIGVLGGIGPQATMDFEARVRRASHIGEAVTIRGLAGFGPAA